jgi:hypothetical protein
MTSGSPVITISGDQAQLDVIVTAMTNELATRPRSVAKRMQADFEASARTKHKAIPAGPFGSSAQR